MCIVIFTIPPGAINLSIWTILAGIRWTYVKLFEYSALHCTPHSYGMIHVSGVAEDQYALSIWGGMYYVPQKRFCIMCRRVGCIMEIRAKRGNAFYSELRGQNFRFVWATGSRISLSFVLAKKYRLSKVSSTQRIQCGQKKHKNCIIKMSSPPYLWCLLKENKK